MIKKSVIDALEPILRDNLSHADEESEVRISPRRWEQIVLYLSTSLPPESDDDAKAIMDNLKTNFRNYLSGASAKIGQDVLKATQRLLSEKYNINVSSDAPIDEQSWLRNLKQQIKVKMKAGNDRAYIPVVSGLPGIAKTTMARKLANSLNMYYVEIDCSPLSPEDVVGIPIPGDQNTIKFAKPKLFYLIQRQIRQQEASGEKKKGYLIFFDELNRVKNMNVFNSLRRVILEKTLGHGLDLPKNAVIMAAINPNDLGTIEMTDHIRDVMDIIPSMPSMKELLKYLKSEVLPKIKTDSKISEAVMEIFELFVKKFKGNVEAGKADSFFLDVGTEVYASPREYQSLIVNVIKSLERAKRRINQGDEHYYEKMKTALYEAFEMSIRSILTKHGGVDPNFMAQLKLWFLNDSTIDTIITDLSVYKSKAIVQLNKILPNFIGDHSKHLYSDNDFVNYMNSVNANELSRDFANFLRDHFKDLNVIKNMLAQESSPKKVFDLEKEMVNVAAESVTELEYVIREIVHALRYYNKVPGGLDAVLEGAIGAVNNLIGSPNIESMAVYEKFIKIRKHLRDYVNQL